MSAAAYRRIAEWSRACLGDVGVEVLEAHENGRAITLVRASSRSARRRERTIPVAAERVSQWMVELAWEPWRVWNALTPPPAVDERALEALLAAEPEIVAPTFRPR